jgi:ADP-ribose pyrophosphatase YjhB (NUDIX family)
MGASDITVRVADGKFNYRVGAVIIDSDEILMVKNSGSSFYYTVGGRIRFGESAQEAVLREAFEETKINLEIDRLAYIHENFFTMDSDGESYHEVCLFFLMKQNNLLREMKQAFFQEEYGKVTFHWIPIKNLNSFHLYPEFFKTELLKRANDTKYIITKNGITI